MCMFYILTLAKMALVAYDVLPSGHCLSQSDAVRKELGQSFWKRFQAIGFQMSLKSANQPTTQEQTRHTRKHSLYVRTEPVGNCVKFLKEAMYLYKTWEQGREKNIGRLPYCKSMVEKKDKGPSHKFAHRGQMKRTLI